MPDIGSPLHGTVPGADIAPTSDRAWLVPLLCLLATGALLGLSTSLAKLAIGAGLSPLAFLTWSVGGAALALTAANLATRKMCQYNGRTLEYFVVAALLSVAVPNLILFSAIPHIGAGFVALSIAFPPLYTYLGALLLGMERFHAGRATGVALALAGALYMAILKLSAPGAATFWILATLSAPVILAAGNIYRTLRWPPGARPDALAPGMLAASAILLALFGGASGFSLALPFSNTLAVQLVGIQIVAFSVQYILFFILQQRGGPLYLSLLGSVAAVVGVPVAMLLLGEAAPRGLAIGAVLIAAGIALVTVSGRKAPPPAPAVQAK